MAQQFLLSEADRAIVLEVIAISKARRFNPPSRSPEPTLDYRTPETYIAYVPTGGIPSMLESGGEWITDTGTGTDDSPQHVECEIYQILGKDASAPYLSDMKFTLPVYNIFPFPITEHQWVLVTRDKGGSWIVTSFGSGTSDTNPKAGAGSDALCMTSIGGLPLNRIPGYNGAVRQALVHNVSGCLVWQTIGPCTT